MSANLIQPCVFLRRALIAAGLHPTGPGEAFVAVQIVNVLDFGELEFIGLRRALSLSRATAHRPRHA